MYIPMIIYITIAFSLLNAKAKAHEIETMTVCEDKCSENCKAYYVPFEGCFSPPLMFPNDTQWGTSDVLDSRINETFFRRTFYLSNNGNCTIETDHFTLPLNSCVGPFGPPRPWGTFTLQENSTNIATY